MHVPTTDEMAKDVKELNFGYGKNLTYITCHRGLSPFTVVAVTLVTASRRRHQAERLQQDTYLSLSDLASSDTTPDPILKSYLGLVDLLCRYLVILLLVKVRRTAIELTQQAAIFENISQRQIASLLWQLFLDARRLFSQGTDVMGNLPVSRLGHVATDLQVGLLHEHMNMPYEDLVPMGGSHRHSCLTNRLGPQDLPEGASEH
jgi:hypothetical protein